MLYFSRWKATAILLTTFVVCAFAIPNFFPEKTVQSWPKWAQRHLVLGLDLQGGSHILLEVDTNAVRKEKLDTFDAGSIADKRKMYDAAQKHYDGKVEAARAFVLDSLTADGKPDNETRKGFFIYADVGLDPDKWSYLEAFRAQNAVNAFVGTKPAA